MGRRFKIYANMETVQLSKSEINRSELEFLGYGIS